MRREAADALRARDEPPRDTLLDDERVSLTELPLLAVEGEPAAPGQDDVEHVALIVRMLGRPLSRRPDEQRRVQVVAGGSPDRPARVGRFPRSEVERRQRPAGDVLLDELEDDALLEPDVLLQQRAELGERVRGRALAAQAPDERSDPLVLDEHAVELGRLERKQREDELLLFSEVTDDREAVVTEEPVGGL